MTQQFFNISQAPSNGAQENIDININGGSANVWLGDTPICTTNCKEALELIVKTLADKFDAKLPSRSEMIYDTVMGW